LAYGATIRRVVDGVEILKLPTTANSTSIVVCGDDYDDVIVGGINCVAFSPDGRFLAGGSACGGMQIWELTTGKEVLAFHIPHVPVMSVSFSPQALHLACGLEDTTGLVWDLVGKTLGPGPRKELAPADLKKLWNDLGGVDAGVAFKASCTLLAAPKQAVPLLRDEVLALPPTDHQRIAKLVADLKSSQFKTREAASYELQRLACEAEPALRQALQGNPELEVRHRVAKLLAKIQEQPFSLREIRLLRALSVLEWIGTAEAVQALKALSQRGWPPHVAEEIQAAVARLAVRGD
jgi:hypothetical protein